MRRYRGYVLAPASDGIEVWAGADLVEVASSPEQAQADIDSWAVAR